MKNLFFVPFAFEEGKATGVNVKKSDALHVYLKNLCVALISARKSTTYDTEVALVCNIKIPTIYESLLIKNGVSIYIETFDSFVFDNDYMWSLAFYKLCALEKMVKKYHFDNYIYTDADVFVQTSLDNVFLELKDNVLLYDINHGLSVNDYKIIVDEFKRFGIDSYITHYGGEFFGASKENAEKFITNCKLIYKQMQEKQFLTTKGDEFIVSISAHKMKELVKNAGAYIFRFWTGNFYLVSTCYKFNEVAILHMPNEKNNGMLKLYNVLLKKGTFPKKHSIYKICHLTGIPLIIKLKNLIKRIIRK